MKSKLLFRLIKFLLKLDDIAYKYLSVDNRDYIYKKYLSKPIDNLSSKFSVSVCGIDLFESDVTGINGFICDSMFSVCIDYDYNEAVDRVLYLYLEHSMVAVYDDNVVDILGTRFYLNDEFLLQKKYLDEE